MKITLSQYAGFCDGVKRAYNMVCRLDAEKTLKPVMILGSLVHNPYVNQKIAEKGIERINRDFFFNSKPGQIGTLIITAHGTGPNIYQEAKKKGIEVLDATCPKVIKAQRLAKAYSEKGYKIIIVGDKFHKEVRGINDWTGSAGVIVSKKADLSELEFSQGEKILVISQTTQNEDFFNIAAEYIKKKWPLAEIISTICHTTHKRQEEIKKLAAQNDAVIVIGSKSSANSNRLFEIAAKVNSKSYFVENAKQINARWFSGAEKVAITAGASTPAWIIEEVIEQIINNK